MTQAVAERAGSAVVENHPAPVNPIMDMIRQAVAAGQPLDVIRELKNMAKELAADEARAAFDAAIADAKAELSPVIRSRTGHNGKYADFATIATAVDPVLSRHGLSYRHRSDVASGTITIICRLAHKGGYFEETALPAPPDTSGNKNAIQAIGSTTTYLQRYTLLLALGLATAHDDDRDKSGGDTLTDEQLAELDELIEQAVAAREGTDRAAWLTTFLAYMKAPALNAIRAKDFAKGKTAILNAIKQGGSK
jgi:hypothetical protein